MRWFRVCGFFLGGGGGTPKPTRQSDDDVEAKAAKDYKEASSERGGRL